MHKKPRIPPLFADPRVEKLRPFDKNAGDFIFDDEAIGKAMRYKTRGYAVDKFYGPTDPTTPNWLDAAKTVRVEQNSIAHSFIVDGKRGTHPNSAAAVSETVTAARKQKRRDDARGWQRSSWKLDVRAPSKKKSPRKK